MKAKPVLTPADIRKIKEIVQYEVARPLEQRIKVLEKKLERKMDYLGSKVMFNGVE